MHSSHIYTRARVANIGELRYGIPYQGFSARHICPLDCICSLLLPHANKVVCNGWLGTVSWRCISLYNVPLCCSWILDPGSWSLFKTSPCVQGQKPGDHVLFRVEIDCVAVMSACPHDVAPYINGEGGPRDVHYQVFEAK